MQCRGHLRTDRLSDGCRLHLVRTYYDTASGIVPGCNSDDDCGAFELCDEGECKQQGCRGKDVSCNLGEWCCGHEAYEDAASCPSGVAEGACFLTPDPWCRSCNGDDDCADITNLGYASYCYELKGQDENGNEISYRKFCSVGCESNLIARAVCRANKRFYTRPRNHQRVFGQHLCPIAEARAETPNDARDK